MLRRILELRDRKFIEHQAENDAQFMVLNISNKPVNKKTALYHVQQGEIVAYVRYISVPDRREKFDRP